MLDRRNFLTKAGLLACSGLVLSGNSLPALIPADQKKIKPKALVPGDAVAITSPAGAIWDENQIEVFSGILKSFGFSVVLGKTLKEKHGYFAGTDAVRAKELNDFFADKKIKGIFCMKGGWGCARLLDKIDYKIIKENPKVFIGFSDITALLLAITAKTGLITYHGPVGNSGWNDFTKTAFVNVTQYAKPYSFDVNPVGEEAIITINPGKASGELFGGNLTVLTSIIGSGYLPDFKGKLLFLEEAKEEPYSIDRMLTQLKLNGVLNSVNGIIFGKCAKCLAEEPQKSFTLNEVLLQHFKPLKVPVFFGAMIGHIENKLTVPLGIDASMDADKGTISLNEASVS
jgi:muramoyltetrapeptide carboxypeptidase